MERKAIIFYLKEIVDLEVARYKIQNQINKEKYDYNIYYNQYGVAELSELPEYNPVVGYIKLIITILSFMIAIGVWLNLVYYYLMERLVLKMY